MELVTQDALQEVFEAMYTDRERAVIEDLIARVQIEFASDAPTWRMAACQQALFVNLLGYPTGWGDFPLLEVMTYDEFAPKRLAYTAASMMWHPSSDAVLMATNRIQKDLTASQPLLASVVLSSLPPYLSPLLAQSIAGDVIKMMTSSKKQVQLKAIACFYSVCLHYPEALKDGFPTLRKLLDDKDGGVVFAALGVFHELCMTNPSNFVTMIPKFFGMMSKKLGNWVNVKLIQILTVMARTEKRLAKKLVEPYMNVMENVKCVTIVYEVARSIAEVPVDDPKLVQVAMNRAKNYVYTSDMDLRGIFVAVMMKILKLCPKLCSQYKDVISECLEGDDDVHKLVALELLASMATEKNLDKIVEKLYSHYKASVTVKFRNQIITTVVELCSQNDYQFVTDFDWYVDVLLDFVGEGAFTCYQILADQFLDLAIRVPATRQKVTKAIVQLFESSRKYKDAMPLVLACAHIIGEYGSNTLALEKILSSELIDMNERVQQAFVTATMRYYLRSQPRPIQFAELIKRMRRSQYVEVQNLAYTYSVLGELLNEDEEAANVLREEVLEQDKNQDEETPIPIPKDMNDPTPIFDDEKDESEMLAKRKQARKKRTRPARRKPRRQKEQAERAEVLKRTGIESFGSDSMKDGGIEPLSKDLAAMKLDIDANASEPKPEKQHRKRKSPREPEPDEDKSLCVLGADDRLKVSVDSVEPEENQVTLCLLIENLSSTVIPSIDISFDETNDIQNVDVASLFEPIEGYSSVEHEITVECPQPNVPHFTKLMLSPLTCGGDPLEVKLRIFPSYYLKPADPEAIDVESCTHEDSITATLRVPAKTCVKHLVRMLHCKAVPNKQTRVINMYATTSYGAQLFATFSNQKEITITVKTTDASLTENVVTEIEHALQKL